MATVSKLPDDPEALKAIIMRLQGERDDLHTTNLRLQIELDRLKKRYYGPRADRLETMTDLAQMLLSFAEELDKKPVHPEAAAGSPLEQSQQIAQQQRHLEKSKGRRSLAKFENLPTTTFVHELSAEQRACPCCGEQRKEIGSEQCWQIEYNPGHFERLEHIRKKYACAACEIEGNGPQIKTAAKPETAVDKGLAGPGLLAFIVTSKFADYLPLYRLEDIFARQGFEVARGTQSVWCGDVADLVEPLYSLMAERVRLSHVVATDDTIMPMLREGKTANARMWVYLGDGNYPYNVFDFTLDRHRNGPSHFLKDYNQVLLADAYGGYNGVVAGNQMTRAGCWAHLRRKVIEAEKTAPEIARQTITMIASLYAVEKQAAAMAAAERLKLREEQSRPQLAVLREKLLDWKQELLPRHPMAEAIGYALSQWQPLSVFCSDGAVPIDNNASEREMKRIVLNRKNSLFVGNPRGGRTAAILASLTSTCRRLDLDPHRYLTQLLVNLPTTPTDQLAAWLPDQWKLTASAQ